MSLRKVATISEQRRLMGRDGGVCCGVEESEETLQRHLDDEVGNLRNEWNKANEQALDIAKLTIQSLIFLNGGGALAIPKLIEGSDKQFHVEAVCMLVCFGIGILLAVLAAVFAFFALGSRSDAIVKRIDQRYRSMKEIYC